MQCSISVGRQQIWKATEAAKPLLHDAIRAVGRIELTGSPYDWVGTGWLVGDNILVTNRHVAPEFVTRKGDGFTFQMGDAGGRSARRSTSCRRSTIRATLVFKLVQAAARRGRARSRRRVLRDRGRSAATRSSPSRIELATQPVATTENVATIGYPAYDSRIPEPDLMERIYGKIYNKKRLAPGGVTRVEQTRILHNCTTLGGNSGSVVVDLDSGEALGLHFSGTFLTTNYAVRADVVKKLLDDVRSGRARPEARAAAERRAVARDRRRHDAGAAPTRLAARA